MKLELEIYGALCSTSKFTINGIHADSNDFGEQTDQNQEDAEDYGCGDMRFTGNVADQKILDKYKISLSEYSAIVEKLEEELSFGSCGWCI